MALANGGTLFLDEIGELPPTLQAELLRALQEGTYKKVGSNTWQKSSFRLVCATNKELADPGCRFRQDLYYRIADCAFRVPSLQERKEDIPVLVNSFLDGRFPDGKRPQIDKLVMDYLTQRNYMIRSASDSKSRQSHTCILACRRVPRRNLRFGFKRNA